MNESNFALKGNEQSHPVNVYSIQVLNSIGLAMILLLKLGLSHYRSQEVAVVALRVEFKSTVEQSPKAGHLETANGHLWCTKKKTTFNKSGLIQSCPHRQNI